MIDQNQYLTKAMSKCWHKGKYSWLQYMASNFSYETCTKCGCVYRKQLDFLTPDGFFKLWLWAQEQEWWKEFMQKYCGLCWDTTVISIDVINPERFANAICKFLKGYKA